MIVVHGTRAFRDRVPGPAAGPDEVSTTTLGPWYATLLRWRRPTVLLVNETTLLPLLMGLAPAKTLLARLPDALAELLTAHRVPSALVEAERAAATEARLAPTANRSVVGTMTDLAALAEHHRAGGSASEDLLEVALSLSRTPCGPLYKRHTSPDRELVALVAGVTGATSPAPTPPPRAPAVTPAAAGGTGSARASRAGRDVRPSEEQHVFVAALLRRAGRVLLVHRTPDRRWYPDAWDLPGGHAEAGELPHQALHRALADTLGIDAVVTGRPWAQVRGADFRKDLWSVDLWSGEPTNQALREHDALAWLNAQEMAALNLADPRLRELVRAAVPPSTR